MTNGVNAIARDDKAIGSANRLAVSVYSLVIEGHVDRARPADRDRGGCTLR